MQNLIVWRIIAPTEHVPGGVLRKRAGSWWFPECQRRNNLQIPMDSGVSTAAIKVAAQPTS